MSTNKECPWELLLRISDAHKVGPEGHAELRQLAATATRLLDVHRVGQETASSSRGGGSRGCGRAESNIDDGVPSSAVKGMNIEMEADRPPDPIARGSAQMTLGIIGEASDSQCSESLDVIVTNPGHTAAQSRSASKSACNGAKGGSIDGFTLRAGRAQRARARCNLADAGSGGTSSAPCMPIAGDGSGGTVDCIPYNGNIASGVAASSSLAAIIDVSDSGYSSDGNTVRGLPASPSQAPTNDSSAVDALVSEAELCVQTHPHEGPVSDLYNVPWTYSFFFSTLDGYFDEPTMTSIAHQ